MLSVADLVCQITFAWHNNCCSSCCDNQSCTCNNGNSQAPAIGNLLQSNDLCDNYFFLHWVNGGNVDCDNLNDLDDHTDWEVDFKASSLAKNILIQKCTAFEDSRCVECGDQLSCDKVGNPLKGSDVAIKVHDPWFHDQYATTQWRHLNCWDTKHPSLKFLINNRVDALILSLFQVAVGADPPLLVSWNELVCEDRWKVLQHIFYQNHEPNSNFVVSLGHIICVTPCKDCKTFQSPITCLWCVLGCGESALPTQECTLNWFSNELYGLCQIKSQMNNGLWEEHFCCVGCHKRRKYFPVQLRNCSDMQNTCWIESMRPPVQPIYGLENITCYMNTALQYLTNSEPIVKHFRSWDHLASLNTTSQDGTGGKLMHSFSKLLRDLSTSKRLNPQDFENILAEAEPSFRGTN